MSPNGRLYHSAVKLSRRREAQEPWCGAELLALSGLLAGSALSPSFSGDAPLVLFSFTPQFSPSWSAFGGQENTQQWVKCRICQSTGQDGVAETGKRHVVPHVQSWQGASSQDKTMKEALRKNKDVAMLGPAGAISPAEITANPPFVFKDPFPLPAPSTQWLGSTTRTGVPVLVGTSWGGQVGFKAMPSQAMSSASVTLTTIF